MLQPNSAQVIDYHGHFLWHELNNWLSSTGPNRFLHALNGHTNYRYNGIIKGNDLSQQRLFSSICRSYLRRCLSGVSLLLLQNPPRSHHLQNDQNQKNKNIKLCITRIVWLGTWNNTTRKSRRKLTTWNWNIPRRQLPFHLV